jgi:hypothetical protein
MPRGPRLRTPTPGRWQVRDPYPNLAVAAARTRVRRTTPPGAVDHTRSAKRCFLLMPETGLCVEVTDPDVPVGVPVSPGRLLAAVVVDNLREVYNR